MTASASYRACLRWRPRRAGRVVLLGVPDAALVDQLKAAAAVGRAVGGACSVPRTAPACGTRHARSPTTPAWRCAARAAWVSSNNALGVRALGYLEPDPLPAGGVSLVTHSGSAFSTLLRGRRGFGFRLAVSSGQELVTDTADYVEYALDDPGHAHRSACCWRHPASAPRLRAALRRAAEQDVPVVILTVGGSPRGRAMVAAHSGALAGEHAGWQAFCAATGAVRVTDLAEFTDTLELFAAGRRGRAAATEGHRDGARFGCRARAVRRHRPRDRRAVRRAGRRHADHHRRLLDDGLAPPTRSTCGAPAPTPAPCSAHACGRWSTTRRWRSPRWPSTWSPSSTATPPTPMPCSTSPGTPRRRWRCWHRWPRRSTRTTAERLRDSGIPVLEGARSGLAAMGHWPRGRCPSTPPPMPVQCRPAGTLA